MTTSVLSAAMFAMLCWVIPTRTGETVLQPPDPRNLQLLAGSDSNAESSGSGDSDSDSSDVLPAAAGGSKTISNHSWEMVPPQDDSDDGSTLILGQFRD